ncbi:MAG TPA: twin-arginine translocase TatA/TatE family subunit [Longimicrobiales bacterium]|nr:twin-arginine translocase TatA/TatE family subunit [Longimicrobiales bacterium]
MPGFGSVGIWEVILILAVLLLVFGAKRLPEIGSALGKGIREFKGSIREIEGEIKRPEEPRPREHLPRSETPRTDVPRPEPPRAEHTTPEHTSAERSTAERTTADADGRPD